MYEESINRDGLLPWIRSSLYYLFMVPSLIIIVLILVAISPFDYKYRSVLIRYWALLQMWLLKVCCGLTYEVVGRENLPSCPYIALPKHQSTWETIATNFLFRQPAWVFNSDLFTIPVFGWGLYLTNSVSIDRGTPRAALNQLVTKGGALLKQGRTMVIFPEGTRVPPGEQAKFEPGGSLLAVKTGTPVIPVALNAGEFWPKESFRKYPGHIKVIIGPLIESKGLKARELNEKVESWIQKTMKENFGYT
ncbi:1-acyl-sn-glycerol-3-phosphate acyltransferase [bacterium BMS3Bbin11]|nr:1-acyl-sn-glycerol-3-phosphate acyltransferase [bacterium BMS3Abin11]GBE46218.1 1-acyl-sn-glycerol-3-phosphate acyltransferase [bacterium BMS3Bbin11]HDH16107.1 1-acyl-sn-glycerol-3-phosphate acyltransferase [Gammaproteobacteria bacterium]